MIARRISRGISIGSHMSDVVAPGRGGDEEGQELVAGYFVAVTLHDTDRSADLALA